MLESMNYPGSKGGAGIYQKIINLIPPHDTYIETHLGGGTVMRMKRPAKHQIGIDNEPSVIEQWEIDNNQRIELACADAVAYLESYRFRGREFVYADPPYLRGTRRSRRAIYKREYTEKQHEQLLKCLRKLPCKVMVSGYKSAMYDALLEGWSTLSYLAQTRGGGMAEEWLWMNYEPPIELHDYRYLGENFIERQRIKRKKERWKKRLGGMPPIERQAVFAAMSEVVEHQTD